MKKYILCLLIALPISRSFAQNYYGVEEEFGKNRIQYKRFEWRTIKSNHFEFNFYRGGDKIAQNAAKAAEAEYGRITELLAYTPFTSMKIFIYNTPKDLSQSNIGLTSASELDGGTLNLSKSRVQLSYTGNDSTFKKELVRQIARLFLYDMLYGGTLKEVLQSSLLLTLPEWYMSGLAAYISEDNNDPIMIQRMQAAMLKNGNKNLSRLTGKEAELVGEAIWNYIAVRYGKDNISNILNLTRIIRAEESSIMSTLGISYTRFLKECKEFYANNATLNTSENIDNKPKVKAVVAPIVPKVVEKITLTKGEVDTDNYEFGEENVVKAANQELPKTKLNRKQDNNQHLYARHDALKITGPTAFQNVVISNDTKTELLVDPVRKIGLKATFKLTDLLENNLMKGGIYIAPNLRNHDIFLQYDKTDKRIDWSFRYDNRSIELSNLDTKSNFLFAPMGVALSTQNGIELDRRLAMNHFMAKASYPISTNLRISLAPFLQTTADYDVANVSNKDLHSTYLGYQGEMVYDATKLLNGKSILGTRAKIKLDKYYGLTPGQGFSRISIDARHYERLLNTFILATRVSYGRSLGDSPKETLLGGAENWLNRSVAASATDASTAAPKDLRGVLFYDFPGNLRGFDFAKIYGTSYLLTNVELRLPLSQYFSKGSITSNFLRNMQFIGFSDIGTAWNGNSGPFSRQNSLNTITVGGNNDPFTASVTNFKNPFLIGYGLGVRTTILGYFVKCDYAWGLQDKQVGTPKLYLSLGYDF